MAIKQKKSGRAKVVVPDEIPVKALKADLISSPNMYYDLFKNIWEEERLPQECNCCAC